MTTAAPAWGVLAIGASGQVAVELLADVGFAARATALGLIAVILAAIAASRRHGDWIPITVGVVSLPLWVSHGAGALSAYDPNAAAASALSPVLLIVGTFLIQLVRHDQP